jgi:NhaA family Na+:H+ antiporter
MSDEPTGTAARGPAPVKALTRFLHAESAGGVVLLVGALVALIWANSGFSDSYFDFWSHEITIGVGDLSITHSIQDWVNDALMTLFFFVVGLEVKRELVTGELQDPRAAALPIVAALGGVVLPAAIFLAIVGTSGDAARGWGVPMATDIAFAVGVLALMGRRASNGAKLFLLTIAVADDILAIIVIALFYSEDVAPRWLLLSVVGVMVILGMRRYVSVPWWYLLPGFAVWLGFSEAGVHPTLAGVLVGLLTPALPVRGRPVLDELESSLHPWSAFLVVPIFALANAGVYLRGGALGDAMTASVTWGVAAGLVVGKLVGISGATFLALKLRVGTLPSGMARREVWGVAALGGIGFTVALFVSELAYGDSPYGDDATVGIFIASIAAGVLGYLLVRFSGATGAADDPPDAGWEFDESKAGSARD